MKQCNICKMVKDFNGFPKNSSALDGYRNQCKECRNEQAKQRHIWKTFRLCRGCLKERRLVCFDTTGKKNSFSWTCNNCKADGFKEYSTTEVKACIVCHQVLPANKFGKGDGEYNCRGQCKVCQYEKEKDLKIEYAKKYYKENKKARDAYLNKWNKKNKEKVAAYQNKYRSKPEYLEKTRRQKSKRYKEDIEYKIKCCIRSRLLSAVKQNNKGGSAIKELGCSVAELKVYLESKFYNHPDTGEPMTWKNHTQEGWHIDHIIPLASFDLTNPDEIKKACHYTNLQPLWAYENRSKGDKVDC